MILETRVDLETVNRGLKGKSAIDRIGWAYETFGDGLAVLTSGGKKYSVIPHLLRKALPENYGVVPIIFVDTHLYPQSTYDAIDNLRQESFKLHVVSAELTNDIEERLELARNNAIANYQTEEREKFLAELSYYVKQEPLREGFRRLNVMAYIIGVQAHQTEHRAGFEIVELMANGYQVNPIIDWTKEQTERYIAEKNLPTNEGHIEILRVNGECGIHLGRKA